MIRIKRIYAPAAADDGPRLLVERLWPRGMTKDRAQLHAWLKEIAPSQALRRWYGHDRERWAEFEQRYRKELLTRTDLIRSTSVLARQQAVVTLVYAAADERRNSAVVLKAVLDEEA